MVIIQCNCGILTSPETLNKEKTNNLSFRAQAGLLLCEPPASFSHEPGGCVDLLRTAEGVPGGGEERQHKGAALVAAEHDKLRVQRQLLRARRTDCPAPVRHRRQPRVGETTSEVWGRYPTGQQGRVERFTHRRLRGPPRHCAIPHHQGQVFLWCAVICLCCQVKNEKEKKTIENLTAKL